MSDKRHVYALFEGRERATAAYKELQDIGCKAEACSVLMFKDLLDEEQLTMSETAAREGAAKGAVIAGVGGALIAGLAALPGGFLGIGPLAAALFGGGAGAAFGGLSGVISGASDPEAQLREIEEQVRKGKVLVAVETEDAALEKQAGEILARHGGVRVD